MKAVIQRVKHASVKVEDKMIGQIKHGLLVFLGVGQKDTQLEADKLVQKIIQLRIFDDEEGKTNLSIQDVQGELLIISQFTLYADCHKGNRPSFINAGKPDEANRLYEYVLDIASEIVPNVQHGEFGAEMKVDLLNDGPFTIILEAVDGKIL